MNIFPSFILLIHVTFSNYLLSVFVYYNVTLYTLPMPIYLTFKFQIVTFLFM